MFEDHGRSRDPVRVRQRPHWRRSPPARTAARRRHRHAGRGRTRAGSSPACTRIDARAIAVSAYAHPEDRHRAVAAGFLAYCAKPVDEGELFATVRRVLRGATPNGRGTRGEKSPAARGRPTVCGVVATGLRRAGSLRVRRDEAAERCEIDVPAAHDRHDLARDRIGLRAPRPRRTPPAPSAIDVGALRDEAERVRARRRAGRRSSLRAGGGPAPTCGGRRSCRRSRPPSSRASPGKPAPTLPGKDAGERRAVAGSAANTFTPGRRARITVAIPLASPPPPNAATMAATSGNILEDFEAGRRVARDELVVFEGWTNTPAIAG